MKSSMSIAKPNATTLFFLTLLIPFFIQLTGCGKKSKSDGASSQPVIPFEIAAPMPVREESVMPPVSNTEDDRIWEKESFPKEKSFEQIIHSFPYAKIPYTLKFCGFCKDKKEKLEVIEINDFKKHIIPTIPPIVFDLEKRDKFFLYSVFKKSEFKMCLRSNAINGKIVYPSETFGLYYFKRFKVSKKFYTVVVYYKSMGLASGRMSYSFFLFTFHKNGTVINAIKIGRQCIFWCTTDTFTIDKNGLVIG